MLEALCCCCCTHLAVDRPQEIFSGQVGKSVIESAPGVCTGSLEIEIGTPAFASFKSWESVKLSEFFFFFFESVACLEMKSTLLLKNNRERMKESYFSFH